MRTKLIEEFKKRFNLSEEDWNFFLQEYQEKDKPLRALCESYEIDYNAYRYLAYQLNFDNSTKASRTESVLNLNKELSIEQGKEYDIEFELEKEVKSLVKKNRQLTKSVNNIREENSHLRKMIKEEDKQSNVYDSLYNDIQNTLLTTNFPEKQLKLIGRSTLKKEGVQAFALLSDLHFNELVKGEYIENHNEFDNQICLDGIDKVLLEVQKYEADTLKIYLAGDLLAGKIHNLDYKGQVPLTQSVVELAKFLADRINTISTQYKKVEVIAVNGNHSRLYDKPVRDLKAFDFEHLLYELMKSYLVKDNIKTNYSKSGYAIDNIGTEDNPKYVGLHHLDMKRLNVTSEADVLRQFETFDELFKVRVMSIMGGHTHKPIFTSNNRGGSIFVNGCVSGSSEYGFNSDFLPLYPFQWVGVWNPNGYSDEQKCIRIR